MADLEKFKYQLKATSVGINGVVYKKSDKVVFAPSEKKWGKVSSLIIAAFKDGHLEMTKESKKAFEGEKLKAKVEKKK